MATGLDRLLRPRSIAVVGGGAWCRNVILKCQQIGFAGDLWAVHPTRTEVAGVPAFASINDLPAAPDACFIGVNRHATLDVVASLRARGAGGAVCFANGFREAQEELGDGGQLQDQLLNAAGDMTIIGPNCYGFVNYLDGALLWPDQHGGQAVDSGVAIVTQSSNIAINLTMQRRGLPLAYVVTVGNQAQTGFADIGMALLSDPRVTALGLHVEGVGDVRALEQLSRHARDLGKNVVVIKAGKSDQARAATMSHTASLAGSDAGSVALFKRLGFGQCHALPVFLETLKALHVVGPLASRNLASMSCSGGEASLIADACVGHDLTFPALTARQKTGLATALGPAIKLANPLDYNTHIWPDTDAMAATFTAMMDADLGLGMVILDFPRADRCDASDWDNVIAAVDRTRAASGKNMAIVASLPENMPEPIAEQLVAMGIVPFCGLDEAVKTAEILADLGAPRADRAETLLARVPDDSKLQSEHIAKLGLAAHAVPVPKGVIARSAQQAAAKAADIGFPVVLKGMGHAHKTEAGAVAVNLFSAAQVLAAAQAMASAEFLVEEMVTDAVAELLVGVVLDPAHGYVLTLGAGGQLTEILQDRVSMLIPSDEIAIRDGLSQLRLFPVLSGHRGRAGVNLDAIIQAIMAVQAYVIAHHGQVSEVEVNPLICTRDAAIAADALIISGEIHD